MSPGLGDGRSPRR